MTTDDNVLDGIRLVTEPSAKLLNERQRLDYREDRRQCLQWYLGVGQDPGYAEG